MLKKLSNKIQRVIVNSYSTVFYGVPFLTYKATLTNRSFDSMSSALSWMLHSIQKKYPDFKLDGKCVAEIGSGKFLSHAVGLKILGAKEVVSFDLNRQFDRKAAILSYDQQVMAKKIFSALVPSSIYSKKMDVIKKSNFDLVKLEKYGIKYLAPFDLHDYDKNGNFDLIISYTVLEHVPPAAISELLVKSIDTLKNGAFFCHFIDLEDHKDSQDNPFEFLRVDKWTDTDCFHRGNRLRLKDWEDIFYGIDDIEYEFVSVLVRDGDLLPNGIDKELSNFASGILAVGQKIG